MFNSNNEGERRPRPRFHREGERPAFGENRPPRPRFHREGDEQRPRFHREGDEQRPRFHQDGEQRRHFKPKRNNGLYSERKQQNYRQQHEDPTKPVRLNKFLANAGICSRREADDFIQAGVITVNGQVVTVVGGQGKTLEVVSLTGRRVMSVKVENPTQKIELNIPKGCYILKIGKVVRKVSVR